MLRILIGLFRFVMTICIPVVVWFLGHFMDTQQEMLTRVQAIEVTVTAGEWCLNLTSSRLAQVDECVLSFGSRPILGSNRFQSLELAGQTQVVGSGAPATGT